MTQREISRADIFSEISQKKISKTNAAKILGISFRHLHRLYDEYQKNGVTALISKHRNRRSNNRLPDIVTSRVSELITIDLYAGFRPTLMCEKLKELHGITISTESTRKLMIKAGVWRAGKKRRPNIHQQRKRRVRWGELIQIDGSPHGWFENRGNPCVLIVFIDDATGRTYGMFFKSETTEAYMITARKYIEKYGRPLAFYSDRYSVFKINRHDCLKKELITQFGRACKELDIELIYANSPQAKGRVERMNQTLQDRLVKEMRLRNINNIEAANAFLPEFWKSFNRKFEVKPESRENSHRILLPEHDLDKILCFKYQRKVSKNLELSYNNIIYQLALEKTCNTIVHAQVTVLQGLEGQISIEYKGKLLPFKVYSQQEYNGRTLESKEIDNFMNKTTRDRRVRKDHPWKQQGRAEAKMRRLMNRGNNVFTEVPF